MDTQFLQRNQMLQNRYRILEKVGSGGFGAVYKAQDTHFQNRIVAVKELRYDNVEDKDRAAAMNAFEREAALLADPNLRDAHLPAIFDRFPEHGRSYLVMAFIEGETLEDYLDKLGGTFLPIETVFSYVLQLCDVLHTLHTHEPAIIFRDLKPANIMRVKERDFLFLIDFGIARLFKQGQSKDTTALGSPGYAAPEQYGKAQSTPRTDIYALGALFHQLLTGRDPSEEPFKFPPVNTLAAVPDDLSDLIASMVDMDPDNRPRSAMVVKGIVERMANEYRANGNRFIAKPVLAASSPSSIPLPSFVSIAPCGPFEHPCLIEAVSWSPDDQIIATRGSDGHMRLWGAADGQLLTMYRVGNAHPGRENSGLLSWSHKGKYLATAHLSETRIQVWEIARSECHCIYDRHSDNVHALAWAPDGKSIASGGDDRDIHLWDPLSGTVRQCLYRKSLDGRLDTVSRLAWSPDAKLLASDGTTHPPAMWNKEKRPAITVWDTKSADAIATYSHPGGTIAAIAWSPDASQVASADTYKHQVHIWHARYGIGEAKLDPEGFTCAMYWKGFYVFAATHEGTVRVWLVEQKKLFSDFQIFKTPRPTLAWSNEGKSLVFITQDGSGLKRYDFLSA